MAARGIAGVWLAMCLIASASAAAHVSPPAHPWSDYQIIMWQPHSALQDAALKALGVSAGMVHADRGNPGAIPRVEADPLLQTGLRWYVENIATDFYSAYHRYFPDHPVNWRFTAAQSLYRSNPLDPMSMVRDPSLSDPRWLDLIRRRILATVAAHRPYRPLYYNLADETGIADLAAYWDFDFSAASLDAMRPWLKAQYGTLAALNREWGSDFANWGSVMPSTTRQAMARTDGNYASWADFKAWMDVAFARALAHGRDAVHAADSSARAGMEGGQVPGWGGYDYSRLVRSVDVMEIYDGGDNVDIVRSLDPGMVILTTSSAGGAAEEWRVWHEWLRGTRGLILWDENNEFAGQEGTIGARGREAAPYFHELRSGLGALLINSVAQADPVAVLYSPASMRVQWMLDWQSKGDAWLARGSEAEGGSDNTVRAAMSASMDEFRRVGIEPRFVTPALIEQGALATGQYRILVLPHAVSLSFAEAQAIRRFVASGGTVIADTAPGVYDEHGKKLAAPRLADLFRPDAASGKGAAIYAGDNAHANAEALRRERIAPAVTVTGPSGAPADDVDTYRHRDGTVEILALQRSHPPVAATPSPDGALAVSLRQAGFTYDLRAGKALGRVDRLLVSLDPVGPALFAIAQAALPAPVIAAPSLLHPGDVADLRLSLAGPSGAAVDIFHLEVLNPAGESVPAYSGTIVARHGVASARLPLAFNDPVGVWTIRVTDWPSGQAAIAQVAVTPRH